MSGARVLVTGATGFVGGHLVLYLLKNGDAQVHCVVRSTASLSADERLRQKLAALLSGALEHDPRFGPLEPSDWSRLHVHAGDITQPGLGLAPADVGGADVQALRTAGLTDGETLDLVHAVALFAWANRLMLNLGEPIHKDGTLAEKARL